MATVEKMSVHKALAELKVMDSRIKKAIVDSTFITANKHSNEKINGMSISDFKETIRSSNQKVNDLIKRQNAMKRALTLSNATTTVTINSEKFTVAEAIYMKNHGMDNLKYLLSEIRSQHLRAMDSLTRNSGDALERRAEAYVLSVIQAQPKESKMSVDSDAIKKLRDTYIKDNTYDLIDPIETAKVIEGLAEYINNFEVEVDAALSESNAVTIIEFEY